MKTAADKILVQFRDVDKSYDGISYAVRNLNLDIQRGEFLTLLGPSGSGKTTTLMMLAGFETVSKGAIWAGDKRLDNVAPHRRGLGVVFQDYALFPHMSVADNIAYPLKCRRVPKETIKDKVSRILELVKLTRLGDRKPSQLSGGQRQRVALSRALVFEPELVLMDEPLGALDRQLREEMQIELRRLHKQLGVTVVYVTHDQNEALTMSDRIAIYRNGEIEQIDTPSALYEYPHNTFVASFVGESNLLGGVVDDIYDTLCKITLDIGLQIHVAMTNETIKGHRMTVLIRPEKIVLYSLEDGGIDKYGAQDGYVVGEVADILYLGDQIKLDINLQGHDKFQVKQTTTSPSIEWAVGQKVAVAWKQADCRALDRETSTNNNPTKLL